MKLSTEEIQQHENLFFRTFLFELNERIASRWNIRFILHDPKKGDKENIQGIDKNTLLILWGDERSKIFPEKYHQAAGAIIKCYCPEPWMDRGVIPMTDNAMIYTPDNTIIPSPCSLRPYNVFFSANLNYRRTDVFRGATGRTYAYPFKISSNYPITGEYPFWHKLEAILLHKLILLTDKRRNFSHLYPDSYICFHQGFMQGSLTQEEYSHRMYNSKVSWCTPGYMTNETSRLMESAYAGTAVICGNLPNTPIYKGHPFHVINDWRKIRQVTDEILNDTARMDEMGCKGRAWFFSHFSPQAQAERIANCLEK